MRGVLVFLIACTSESEPDCTITQRSDITHSAGSLSSGTSFIGVTWNKQIHQNPPERHAAIVFADGTVGTEIRVGEGTRGVAGITTMLWHEQEAIADCGVRSTRASYQVTLQTGSEVAFLPIAPAEHLVRARAAVFDGTAYQLFWLTTSNALYHREVHEDGSVGPTHELFANIGGIDPSCIDAATDGAGTTFLLVKHQGYIFDPLTATTRQVFTGTNGRMYGETFAYAGKLHVHDSIDRVLISFDTSGSTRMQRVLSGPLAGADRFYPTPTVLYISFLNGTIAVDSSLAPLRNFDSQTAEEAAFGEDLVRFIEWRIDHATLTPARIDLVREGAWHRTLATDSELREVRDCGVPSL